MLRAAGAADRGGAAAATTAVAARRQMGRVGGRLDTLESLYRREYAATVRLAGLMLGDFQAGEEVAQDAFARLLDVGDKAADPVSYLRATVTNLCRSRIRRAILARRHGPRLAFADATAPASDDTVVTRHALQRALQGLPPRQREAVVLRYYGGMSEAEVASAMSVTAGSVKTHLHRAIEALCDHLEELR